VLDRQRVEAILTRRFPCATAGQVAAATNALMALAAESADATVGAFNWDVARFLSSDSARADDDPLLRPAADRDAGARR
jgi:hypothetical protein